MTKAHGRSRGPPTPNSFSIRKQQATRKGWSSTYSVFSNSPRTAYTDFMHGFTRPCGHAVIESLNRKAVEIRERSPCTQSVGNLPCHSRCTKRCLLPISLHETLV